VFGRRARDPVAPEAFHAALLEIHRAVGVEGVRAALLRVGSRILEAEHASFFRYEPKWRDLAGVPLGGGEEIRFPAGQGLLGWVAETRAPLVTKRPGREKAYLEAVDGLDGVPPRNLVVLPVVELERLHGVAAFENAADEALGEETTAVVAMLAEQAALALARAEHREEDRKLTLSMAAAFGGAVDAKFASTGGHSRRTTELALRLGEAMGLDEDALGALAIASSLHNVGRVDSTRPPEGAGAPRMGTGGATSHHLLVGEAVLRNIEFPPCLAGVPEIALACHEAVDGSGYPRGARGEELSIGARILMVACAFDHLRFMPGGGDGARLTDEEALAHIRENAGRLYDAAVVRVFDEQRLWDSEKRRHARIEVASAVEVSLYDEHGRPGPSVENEVLDISEGGLQFRSASSMPVWALAHLVIRLPTDSIEALAKIARVVPDGDGPSGAGGWRIGVSFLWYGRTEGAGGGGAPGGRRTGN